MKTVFDIAIIGAGISGLSLALLLAKRTDLSIIVIDAKTPGLSPRDSRVSAVTLGSVALFKELSVWEAMVPVSPFQTMCVWDEATRGEVQFSAEDSALDALGFIIENRVMQNALLEKMLQQSSVTTHWPLLLQAVYETESAVCLETDAGPIFSSLVIGCDGAHSWLREHGGFASQEKQYAQTALVATVRTEKPHQSTAWQRFLATGPLAFLPLTDPHLSSIVWSLPPDLAEENRLLPANFFCQQLTQAFDYRLGLVEEVGSRLTFPLVQRQVDCCVKSRSVLVADAAHTIHPLAGQGLNMGLRDVMDLVLAIENNLSVGRSIYQTRYLRSYARKRKAENAVLFSAVSGLNSLFARTETPVLLARSLGLSWVNRLLPLKQFFVKQASK